jgi:hypothetical protein
MLDQRVPDKTIMISQDLAPCEEAQLIAFLDKNNDVFTWRTSDLTGVSRDIIEHKLQVNLSVRPRKQKPHKMLDEKVAAAKAEVQRLMDTRFISEVRYLYLSIWAGRNGLTQSMAKLARHEHDLALKLASHASPRPTPGRA